MMWRSQDLRDCTPHLVARRRNHVNSRDILERSHRVIRIPRDVLVELVDAKNDVILWHHRTACAFQFDERGMMTMMKGHYNRSRKAPSYVSMLTN